MIFIKQHIIIKLLDSEIILSKNKKIYVEKTSRIIENNFITNHKLLEKGLRNVIKKYNLSNVFIQNKIYILINKLYCETNLFVLKTVMFNLGFSNYKIIYEEDLYKNIYDNILSIWQDNGVYIKKNVEKYIDINNRNDIKKIGKNTLLITSNDEIINKINKDLILYEYTDYPIFKMIGE